MRVSGNISLNMYIFIHSYLFVHLMKHCCVIHKESWDIN